jgi:hypothetical protein
MQTASIALSLSFLLLVWLRTNAFAEYMRLFRVNLLKLSEYYKIHDEGYGGSYVDFLVEYYNDCFFVRLVSCPVCLSFWLGVSSSIYLGMTSGVIIAPLTLFFYLVFNKLL